MGTYGSISFSEQPYAFFFGIIRGGVCHSLYYPLCSARINLETNDLFKLEMLGRQDWVILLMLQRSPYLASLYLV